MAKLWIVGGGPGQESMATGEVRAVIGAAERVLSTTKLDWEILKGKKEQEKKIQVCTLPALMEALLDNGPSSTAVLVSGDCGFFSVSDRLVQKFADRYEIELVNGISSIQYFSAKIAVAYDDAEMISMHGRDGRIVPKVSYHKKVFALTGGDYKAHDVCRLLSESGLGHVAVWVGEKLSRPDETIIKGTAEELRHNVFDNLSVMCIRNETAQNPHEPLCDEDFIRGGAPMTKEEVRAVSLQKLRIQPRDTVYDIGAGTGSVSVESARRAFAGYVYAIEVKEEACLLMQQNRAKHGAYNMTVIKGKAPDAFEGLAAPDKAFIGGSMGNMDVIVRSLIQKNPDIRIVANAVTLQSIGQILESFSRHGLHTDTICINAAKSKKLGGYDMMTAQNPIYIVTGYRQEDSQSNDKDAQKSSAGGME